MRTCKDPGYLWTPCKTSIFLAGYRMDMGSHCQSNISTSDQLGLYKKPGIFLNDPKSRYLFFTLIVFSGGELPVDNKCEFSSLLWVRASLVESQQMPSFVCILHSFPFMFDHFCINFLSFCFHVLSCSVAMYQRYRSSKADMFKPVRWVSAQTLAFFNISLSFLLLFSYPFGGMCRLPSSGMNMYMYKLVIHFFFTLIVFWAGNALAVLRCKPS